MKQLDLNLPADKKNIPRQMALDLSLPISFSSDDYVVSESNKDAYKSITEVSAWTTFAFSLWGEQGTGKSHLSAIWAEMTGARRLSSKELETSSLKSALVTGALLLEDATPQMNTVALFHLLNLIKEERAYLLITSQTPLSQWVIEPKDALSRLRAIPSVQLPSPDDDLLKAVYMKLFTDRQLSVDFGVIDALVLHSDRTLAKAKENVERLDKLALETGKRVSKSMVMRL